MDSFPKKSLFSETEAFMTRTSLQQLHQELFQGNYLFASYRLPYETKVFTIVQTSSNIELGSFKESDKGFLFAPFNEGENPLLWIEADVIFENNELVYGDISLDEKVTYTETFPSNPPISLGKEQYLNTLSDLVEILKKNELRKAVFTRSLSTTISDKSESDFFHHLNEKYHSSFNYLINLPGGGSWIGASPEVLLRKKEDGVETMALAGSRRANGSAESWSKKDIEEQELVAEHIENQLKGLGYEYSRSGPNSLDTGGGIEHLCTQYTMKDAPENVLKEIIDQIHPTPAVCGLPVEESRTWLQQNEHYARSYYTGYLGPVNIGDTVSLFVNLRCAQIIDGMAYLYVGGGIISSSDPQEEWAETELKSRTLLDIIESQGKI